MTNDDAMATLASMRLEDGRRWGEVAVDWQLADARAILTPGPDDRRLHWFGRPKAGSKTTDLAGVAMAWLLTQAAPLDEGYVIAADQEQARRLLDRARGLLHRTPGLGHQLEIQQHAIVNRANGARVVALAADAAGAEGMLTPLLLLDELPQWPNTRNARAMWDACYSTVPKVRGLRFVVIGHAGIAGSWQHALYERFKTSPAWRVHDVPGPLPWIDPGLLDDQRATLASSQYLRRHMNEWAGSEDALTTVEDLRACVTLNGPLVPRVGVRYVIGLDLGLKNDRTVGVVCHAEAIGGGDPTRPSAEPRERERRARHLVEVGAMSEAEMVAQLGGELAMFESEPVRIVLDRIQVWQGSKASPVQLSEVEEWIGQAHYSFNRAPLVFDPWQAIGMGQRLGARGVEVEEYAFGSASVGRLANVLHQLLRDRALALPDDPELLEELASVRIVERTPGVMRLDHDAGRHDDRAVAIALAAQRLLSAPARVPTSVTSYRNDALIYTR